MPIRWSIQRSWPEWRTEWKTMLFAHWWNHDGRQDACFEKLNSLEQAALWIFQANLQTVHHVCLSEEEQEIQQAVWHLLSTWKNCRVLWSESSYHLSWRRSIRSWCHVDSLFQWFASSRSPWSWLGWGALYFILLVGIFRWVCRRQEEGPWNYCYGS